MRYRWIGGCLKTQWIRWDFPITQIQTFTLVRALSKLCLLSMVYELRFDHRSFTIVSFVSSHTNLWVTCTASYIHTLDVFSECAWNFTQSLWEEVASQSKIINVWNISSLIFEQVHSSDFAWWWCIIKCWHNITIFAYELLFLFLFPFQNGTLQLAWFGSAHLLSVINALLAALNLLSIIHHIDPPSEVT